MSRRALGVLFCLISAVAYGTAGIFGKLAFEEGLSVSALLSARFVIAAVMMWVLVFALGEPARPSRRGVAVGLVLCSLAYIGQTGAYFSSLERIDAALTILLAHVAPVFVALGAVLFGRERLSRLTLVSLPIAVGGTALIALGALNGPVRADGVGIMLALLCALTYAAYILLSHAVVGEMNPITLTAWVTTGVAVAFCGSAVATGDLPDTTARGWLLIVGLAVFSTVIAITFLAAGTAVVGPSVAVLLSTLEPVTATALALAVLGESLTAIQWVGGVLVIASVVILAGPWDRPAGADEDPSADPVPPGAPPG